MTLALTAVLAAGIGISLGLLGGGGSILAVPLLVYVSGLPAKEAIATSLVVVGATSAAGLLPHARAGRVRWRTGLIFGAAGMVGAYAGGRLGAYVPERLLLAGFGIMMLATAVAMLRGRGKRTVAAVESRELPVLRTLLDGTVVGLVTGLVGAGGGFLVVPALALLGGLPMSVAVGTSLLVIAMKSAAGAAGYLASVPINWGLAAMVTAAAIVGSFAGARLAGRIPEPVLRRAFGWFVVVMAAFVLVQQLPSHLTTNPLLWVAAGAVIAASALVAVTRRPSPPSRPSGTAAEAPADVGHGPMIDGREG